MASGVLRLSLGASVLLGTAPGALAAGRDDPVEGTVTLPAGTEARQPTQVVVFERATRTTTVVSHDVAGAPAGTPSSRPSMNNDGSLVAFQSDANLVPDDSDGTTDVYLWDRAINTNQVISNRVGGGQSNGASRNPSIAADGSIVAFASTSTNIAGGLGLDGTTQVLAWDRASGGVSLVSAGDGGAGSGASGDPSASVDGRVVAFESLASDLVQGDTNGTRDVFLRDLARGATIRASIGNDGRQPAAESRRPSVSGDGGAVVFDSASAALAPPDTNGARDVFVRDLPPAVTVAPNPLDFGVVPLQTPATQSVAVLSIGWTPVAMGPSAISGTNAGDFTIAGDACAGLLLPTGATCTIAVLDVPQAEGRREATLEVTDNAVDTPQLVSLIGGVPGPELRLEPDVGPPGIVTVVHGTGLPTVGALVNVAWDRGITQQLEPVSVGSDGTVVLQVLVFHHDLLGPRQLLISPAPGSVPFPPQSLPFLVVPAPLQPPGNGAITFLDPDLQTVLIRR